MHGTIVRFNDKWPVVRFSNGKEIQCDYLSGAEWKIGDEVYVQTYHSTNRS